MSIQPPFGLRTLSRRARLCFAVLSIVAIMWPRLSALALPPLPDDFINDDLVALGVFDLAQATPLAIDATGRNFIEHIPEFGDMIAKLREDHDAFVRGGGRYVVIAGAETESKDLDAFMPMAGVFVDGEHCDEATLTDIIKKHASAFAADPVVERHGDWLLVWKSDRLRLTNRKENGPMLEIPNIDPKRAEQLRSAFASLDGRAVGVMIMPTAKMHKDAEEQFDEFPEEMADSPFGISMSISRATSMHGWIDLGHNPSVTGVVEMPDAPGASKLNEQIQALPSFMKDQMAQMGEMPPEMLEQMGPEFKLMSKILTSITSMQQGSTVTVSIGQANLREILDMAGPILEKAKKQAAQQVVASNSRQLGMALIMYAVDHDNQWPASLDELVHEGGMTREQLDEWLTHPVTGEKIGFVYVKPDRAIDQLDNPAAVPVIYEMKNGSINKNGYICYADGHVQMGGDN